MDRQPIIQLTCRTLFVLIFLLTELCSQQVFAQRYIFDEFGQEDGLPSKDVYELYSDSKGVLWIATAGGLCSYDGVDLNVYTVKDGIPEYEVTHIEEDKRGNVWFRSSNHVFYFDGLKMRSSKRLEPYQRASSVFRDQPEQMWLQTEEEVVSISKDFELELKKGDWSIDNQIYATYYQDQFLQYLATVFGLIRCRDGDCVNLTTAQDKTTQVYDIESFKGAFWLQTDEGMQKFDGLGYSQEGVPDILRKNITNRILKDPRGYLWFGTIKGLFRYDGETFEHYTEDDGLPNNRVRSLFLDQRGLLWITNRESVSIFDGEQFTIMNVLENEQNNRRMRYRSAICEDIDGNIWLNQPNGLKHYNRWNIRVYDEASGFPSKAAYGLSRDSLQNLWYINEDFYLRKLTKDAVIEPELFEARDKAVLSYVFHNDSLYLTTEETAYIVGESEAKPLLPDSASADEQLRGFSESKEGGLWMFSSQALYMYQDSSWLRIQGPDNPYAEQNYPNELIILRKWKDEVPLAVCHQGLYSYEDGDWKKIFNSPPGDMIYDVVVEDYDVLWLLSVDKGLQKLTGNQTISFTTEDGLSSNLPLRLGMQDSILWITYQHGIDRINVRQFARTQIPMVENLGQNEGFESISCKRALQVFEGDVWISTEEAIYRYDSSNGTQQQGAVNVSISDLQLFREDVDWVAYDPGMEQGAVLPKKLVLEEEENFLSFHFKALTFRKEQIYFQYQLKGYDEQWSDPVVSNVAHYPNLPAGTYEFLVKGSSRPDAFGQNGASFSFEISAPFYKRTWFIASLLSLGILSQLLTTLYIFHLRKRLNRQNLPQKG